MKELRFRPLKSTLRYNRFINIRQEAQERKQALLEAWGSPSDDYARTMPEILAILAEDPRWLHPSSNSDTVHGYGYRMRKAGWHLPNRERGLRARAATGEMAPGLPPSKERYAIADAAKHFITPIPTIAPHTTGGLKRAPILLNLLESGPMTTQDFLTTEKLDIKRGTLLKELSKLADEELVKRSTQDYNGAGRGYQWTLVHIP